MNQVPIAITIIATYTVPENSTPEDVALALTGMEDKVREGLKGYGDGLIIDYLEAELQ